MSAKYVYTDDMGEISGFGGGYEDTCRKMVIAGVEWFDAHPEAKPQFHTYKNIYGVCSEDNDDAKQLTKAVIDVTNGDCTGAMHQAAIARILWIRTNGWEKYCVECRKAFKEESEKK